MNGCAICALTQNSYESISNPVDLVALSSVCTRVGVCVERSTLD